MKRIHFIGFCFLFLLFNTVLSFSANAQKQHQMSSGEILHSIKKLNVLGSVLYIAAHPDDENTRLIAHLSKERLFLTGYLSMTRGDGGQNLIGNEQGVALGMIRTQELLAARRMDGGQQFFTLAYDFGFSKRTDEALAIWDKEKILADAVWVIRNFKPDVIITRFPEDNRAGHGHHSGSAIIAREAFVAAADPNRFAEQFKYGVGPWQAKRILWNTFSFGSTNTTAENQMKIEVGQYIPLLGKSIGEISAESKSNHRSQGFGSASTRGTSTEYFTHVLGDKAEIDPMDGIKLSWNRVKGADVISKQVDDLVASFDAQFPENAIEKLIAIKKELNNIDDTHWKKIKKKEVDQLILMCSGLHIEALSNRKQIKQGDTLQVLLTINNRSGTEVKIQEASLHGIVTHEQVKLKKNSNWNQSFLLPISISEKPTQPYWLVDKMNKGSFNVSDQNLIGDAENKPTFQVYVKLDVKGETIEVFQPVQYRHINPAIGEFFHPVNVVPSKEDGNTVMQKIEHEHIPSLIYFSENKQIGLPHSLKTTGKKIGYFIGAGDKVPSALEMMGFDVAELGLSDIYAEKLQQFDAIVVGVRAYNVNEWLNEKHSILMDYVNQGGNMVVQYNTNSFAGPIAKMKIGPKPFTISGGRVTEEDALVKFIDPNHPLLNFPNKIMQDDFNDWIQERGVYFANGFSNDYEAVLSMHDQGEVDLLGSLIVCNEGKGRFIYTGLSFFRQLPAGVPGAYRLFANLVSNPNKKLNDSK